MTLKRLEMKKPCLILVLGAVMLFGFGLPGCYAAATGRVVDAETGEPIEGAVMHVQWTVTKGLGLTHTERYKVIEVVTNKDGEVTTPGAWKLFSNRPEVVVYKKGYVAWRSDYIFPDYEKRKGFRLRNGFLIKMEHFKKGHSYAQHTSFIRTALSLDSSSKLDQAYSWERPLASKEDEIYREKLKSLKPGELTNTRIWKEIIEELYFKDRAVLYE